MIPTLSLSFDMHFLFFVEYWISHVLAERVLDPDEIPVFQKTRSSITLIHLKFCCNDNIDLLVDDVMSTGSVCLARHSLTLRKAYSMRWMIYSSAGVAVGLLLTMAFWFCTSSSFCDSVVQAAEENLTSAGAAHPETKNSTTDREGGYRNPRSLALSADKRLGLVANTGGSVALVDFSIGQKLSEISLVGVPWDIQWLNDQKAYVTLRGKGQVVELGVVGGKLEFLRQLPVGLEPCGLAIDGQARPPLAYVAVSGGDDVAVVDLDSFEVLQRLPAGGLPQQVIISPDRKWLAVAAQVPARVTVFDLATLKVAGEHKVYTDGFNLGPMAFEPETGSLLVSCAINRGFPVNFSNIERGWVIDNRLVRMPIPQGELGEQEQLGLDEFQKGVGDAYATRVSPNGEWIAITASGSHEIILVKRKELPWMPGDPGDFVRPELIGDKTRYRRISLAGRPLDFEFLDDRRMAVANGLKEAVEIVDLEHGKIEQSIAVGTNPHEKSLARQGEEIFFDAKHSLHQWFSCHSCHPDGHTAGQLFDTQNDRGYGAAKLTPTLYHVAETGPWTWHGWQRDLENAMKRSIEETMQSEKSSTQEQQKALVAYLETLRPASWQGNPLERSQPQDDPDWHAGKAIFFGKGACDNCHQGPQMVHDDTFEIGLKSRNDSDFRFNPPSLLGLNLRRRFLHDGRSRSLRDALEKYHAPEKVVGEKLSPEELQQLLRYLESL
ncbi:Di-heme cytochrome c peroxidase [Planctopirus ephydatiae]|uniref:Di-heme cytochrome c peroxidase n=2 Tax=Planctopirus ephydatiae TaxID=2528019 RepID=A0A518GQ12_9PLAN|nr:Di-heme cytochrome c peroxidase [Planctopirus ephydatiae]